MNDQFIILAIDGGAASGKSSTSRLLAERFNLMHVDTGSHYRAVTLALSRKGTPPDDPAAIRDALRNIDIDTVLNGRHARIRLNGSVPTTEQLRSPEVNANVSAVAAAPQVRQFLFDYQRSQREVAKEEGLEGLVMEGRDIGSVIFPDADFRFFLEAAPEARAQRRAAEGQTDLISERDRIDSTRKAAPLRCPDGAIRIDNSDLGLEEVVDEISSIIRQKL